MSNPLDELMKKVKEKKEVNSIEEKEETPKNEIKKLLDESKKESIKEKQLPETKPKIKPETKNIFESDLKEKPEKTLNEKQETEKILDPQKLLARIKAEEEKAKKETEIQKEDKKESEEDNVFYKTTEEKSEIEKKMEEEDKKEIDSYGKTKIYELKKTGLKYYFTPVPRPNAAEKAIINTLKEAATRLITISPYKIRDPEARRNVYYQRIMEMLKENPQLKIPLNKFGFYADVIVREMVGYGLIDELIKDDKLEEIMIIGAQKPVYVFHREYEMMLTNIEFYSDKEILDLINRIARQIGRRVDISVPLLDARLIDGSRVNATIPPASVSGASLTIRKFRSDPYSIIDLIKMKTIDVKTAAYLWLFVEGMKTKPANILIAGGTGSGKTTTLNVLTSFVSEEERIITIEDTAELNLPLKHWIRMEARAPGLEGTGEITLDILTKNSLRMRPDRIVVGEIRHAEAFSFFTAINTGHDGAITGNTLIQLSDGNLIKIKELIEKVKETNSWIKEKNHEFAESSNPIKVKSLNKETLEFEDKEITRVWKTITPQTIKKIKLKSGKTISLTKDHPIYRIQNGIQEINAGEIKKGDFITIPKAIEIKSEEKLFEPYLIGLVYGDGHIRSGSMEFVNKENSLINSFEETTKQLTNNLVKTKEFEGFKRTKVHDVKLIQKMQKEYNIPLGNKTKKFKLNEKTLSAKNQELSQLIKGLFDSESHVNLHSNSIQFSTSNPDLAKKMPLILLRYGIKASISSQEKDGKGNAGPYYRISIYGKQNLIKYKNLIGFNHKQKNKQLEQLIIKSKEAHELIPNIPRILRDARSETKITQIELGKLIGNNTPSVIGSYETGKRNPSRKQLKKICSIIEKKSKIGKELNKLVNSNLMFEEIVSVTEKITEKELFDLTIKDNHNYIANGILISNCLGTVHANSAEETIVRVTNPPMNVPQIMMSGLNFILVQNRIHDKKKGTIRRITEIAEVTGAIEGKTKTQTLFEWDASTDSINKTEIGINYLKELEKYTGMNSKQIQNEVIERTKFLESLEKKNIHEMEKVSKACKEFLNQKK